MSRPTVAIEQLEAGVQLWRATGSMSDLEANVRTLLDYVADLEEASRDLLANLDMDSEITADLPDDESVGWNGDGSPMPLTFGHIRRLARLTTPTDPEAG